VPKLIIGRRQRRHQDDHIAKGPQENPAVAKCQAHVIAVAIAWRKGRFRLPIGDELLDPEYCQPVSDNVPGAQLIDVPGNRQLINVTDCGVQRLRFLWHTPSVDTGPIWFAGSAVASDDQGDTGGDGVTEFARVLGSPSSEGASAFNATGDCSASHAPRSGSWSWLVACAAACALPVWRRGRRKKR